MEKYDKIIIGAGLYGLYSALFCAKRGQHVIVLECDPTPFRRATYINQARVHQGYHYPRSISTAMKSAGYFERFNKDYAFCVNKQFDQIYATSSQYSWSDGKQFKAFCKAANIPCEELNPGNYFKEGMCDGVFRTREYTYDAMILKDYLLEELKKFPSHVEIKYGVNIISIEKLQDAYVINTDTKERYKSGFVLNATYAGTNQILDMVGFEKFSIKYELCEIILCDVNDKLKDIGFTVMDGPFFSIMPFGKTGFHSLTSVTFTPHTTSYDAAGKEIDAVYNSKNIEDAYGTNPDLLIYAGLRAEKYLANNAPEKDMELIYQAEENIEKIGPKKLVLISTIDVFKMPKAVDEDSVIDTENLHAYGYNRYQLELWVRKNYPDALIVRLPGLFGKNIKKNFIYDFMNVIPFMLKKEKFEELVQHDPELRKFYVLQENGFYKVNVLEKDKEMLKERFRQLGFSALNFTDSRSRYQFYNLGNLWRDINIALSKEIKLWHSATEPVSAGEVYEYLTGEKFTNELGSVPADYDYRTLYANVFGGRDGYIINKSSVLEEIKRFIERSVG